MFSQSFNKIFNILTGNLVLHLLNFLTWFASSDLWWLRHSQIFWFYVFFIWHKVNRMQKLPLTLGALSLNINIDLLHLIDNFRDHSRLNLFLLSCRRPRQWLFYFVIGLWVRVSLGCTQKQCVCDLTVVVGSVLVIDRSGWLWGVCMHHDWVLFSERIHRINFFCYKHIESLFRKAILFNFQITNITGWLLWLW